MPMERAFAARRQQHVLRGPALGWWLVLAAIVLTVAAAPWLPPVLAEHLQLADGKAALLGWLSVGLLWRARQSRQPAVRLVRVGLALGMLCCWLGWQVFAVELWFGRAFGVDLVEEVLHGLLYLVLVWALDRVGRDHPFPGQLPVGFAAVFVLAMFGYLLLLPALVAPREYDGWAPTFLFFLFLDAYLAWRCLQLAWHTRSPSLARCLRAAALAFVGMAVADGLDWALFTGLYRPTPDDGFAMLRWLPWLPWLVLASPGRWRQRRRPLSCWTHAGLFYRPMVSLLVLALFPILLHLVGYGFGVLLEHGRAARDLYLVAWLVLVAVAMLRVSHATSAAAIRATPVAVRPAVPVKPARTDPFLSRFDAVLATLHPDPALDLARLADAMAMSPRQLQRRLKAAADTSPADYLRRYRLQRAAELLAQSGKVTWVAQAVGFAHHSHFGRCFKQQFGLTPGEYQARCQQAFDDGAFERRLDQHNTTPTTATSLAVAAPVSS